MPTPVSSTRAQAPCSSEPTASSTVPPSGGVGDGVGDQVGQHPHQCAIATDDLDGLARHVAAQQHPGAFGGDPVGRQHVVDHLVESHLVVGGLHGTGIDLRHLEEVVDQLGQPDRLVFDVAGVRLDLVVGEHAVGEGLGDRADARQRRAQVVADECDQLPARLLGGPFGLEHPFLPDGAPGLVAGQHDGGGNGHHRHDHQHDDDAFEALRDHESAGAEYPRERGQRRDEDEHHHARRQRPRPGQPDDDGSGHHDGKGTGQRDADEFQ